MALRVLAFVLFTYAPNSPWDALLSRRDRRLINKASLLPVVLDNEEATSFLRDAREGC
jgi:hypothetical protein